MPPAVHRAFPPCASRLRALLLSMWFVLSGVPLLAQPTSPGAAHATTAAGVITGRLADHADRHALGAGSITVFRTEDGSFASGAQPSADGTFRVDGLAPGRYTVRVRVLGYAPLARPGVVVAANAPAVDLGTFVLSRVAARLQAQAVTAEREDIIIAPDRNIYSAKNMVTASGGSAIDVLRNVPAVEVDASNAVSLRGSQNVVIQINGRTSPLKGSQLGNFLAQLPASAIKHVEVATNPSAKNDPEGTAGIINIVLDQDAEIGWSGALSANAGSAGERNGWGNVGHQAGPFTWFVSYGLFTGRQSTGGYTEQTNLAIPVPAYVESRLVGQNEPLWQNGTLRTEYRLTKHDAISVDAMLSGGRSRTAVASYFDDLDTSRAVIGIFDQFSQHDGHSSFGDVNVAYHRTGKGRARTFSTELYATHNTSSYESSLDGVVHEGGAATGVANIPSEHDVGDGSFPQWTVQSDLTQPFGGGSKLEVGLKELVRHHRSDFSAAYLDSASGQYVVVPARSIASDYQEQIGAEYAVLSQQLGKLQAQAGLRLEETASRLGLPTAPADSQRFDSRYASAFPSGILAYNFTPLRQLKLSYSRRVSRPHPSQLSPVWIWQDARTGYHGNPTLRAEYTDALELALQDAHGWGTIQLTPYVRRTAHAVRFIQATDTSGITTGTFENLASTLQVGADLNATYRAGRFTLFGGGHAYRYSSDASNLAGPLSTRATVWSARANATWHLGSRLDAQLFTNYRAPMAIEGGRQRAFTMVNVALREKLWDDRGAVTLRIMDPFNQYQFGSVTTNPLVIHSSVRRVAMRGIMIGFSRDFGEKLKLRPRQPDEEQQQQADAPPGTPAP